MKILDQKYSLIRCEKRQPEDRRRKATWVNVTTRDLNDWEWRALLHLSWVSSEKRREILSRLALEAITEALNKAPDLSPELKAGVIDEAITQAMADLRDCVPANYSPGNNLPEIDT